MAEQQNKCSRTLFCTSSLELSELWPSHVDFAPLKFCAAVQQTPIEMAVYIVASTKYPYLLLIRLYSVRGTLCIYMSTADSTRNLPQLLEPPSTELRPTNDHHWNDSATLLPDHCFGHISRCDMPRHHGCDHAFHGRNRRYARLIQL